MERYLTPIEYEQYLHDKAYHTAMAHTFPTVTQVFVVIGIFIIAVLVWGFLESRREKQRRQQQRAEALRRETAQRQQEQQSARNGIRLAKKNDAAWFKAGGGRN